MTASGTTNQNGTVHFKEWMIAILPMAKTDLRDGWLQLECLNK